MSMHDRRTCRNPRREAKRWRHIKCAGGREKKRGGDGQGAICYMINIHNDIEGAMGWRETSHARNREITQEGWRDSDTERY